MKVRSCAGMLVLPAPVAQMDRVLASEAKGRAFESRRARHFDSKALLRSFVRAAVANTRMLITPFSIAS